MKFDLTITSEQDGEVLAQFKTPTFEMLEEMYGAWKRANEIIV